MIRISLCMIVKDEEAVLERCLKSIANAVEEIIIVDTGSSDRTKEIAADFTDQIYDFQWVDDFAAARNFSFSKAKMDYLLWLDADEYFSSENLQRFLDLKATLPMETDVVMMETVMGCSREGAQLTFYRERLLKRGKGFAWEGAVHEVIAPHGIILYSPISIFHQKEKQRDFGRNLRIYEQKIAKKCSFTPRDCYYYGRELVEHGCWEAAETQLRCALEGDLWKVDRIHAYRLLSCCRKEQNDQAGAKELLFLALSEGVPCGELCCDIGESFLEEKDWESAAFWYGLALDCPMRRDGFLEKDCYGYIPALSLCVCYYHLGQKERSREWNERAAQYKPNSPQVAYNRKFFKELKS